MRCLAQDDVSWYECDTLPWAAMVAFASLLVAAHYGHGAIVVGNERSANEGNTTYMGRDVNHQYDKSFAWETVRSRLTMCALPCL